MSGFGGGFGLSQQQPGFGSQQRSSSQPDFDFSGGQFGSTAPAAPSFGGFGASSNTQPFGASAPTTSFGTSSNLAPFASSQANMGQPPSFGTQAAAPAFGSSTTTMTPSFGNAPQTFGGTPQNQPFGGAPSTQQTFGAPPASPFQSGTQSQQPFGGTTPTAQQFGSAPSSQAPTFGQTPTTTTSPFAQSSAAGAASPFGNATTTQSTISFGVSANVIQSNDSNTNTGFSSNDPTSLSFPASTTTFPSSSFQTSSAFGSTAFGATSDSEDMGDSDANTGQYENPQQSSWSGDMGQRGGSLSPLPEQGTAQDGSMSPTRGSFSPPVPDPDTTKKTQDPAELARLKAKLQEKINERKKKLEKKRKEKAAAATASKVTPTPSSTLNADAPPFTPGQVSSLAERNKRRFAAPSVRSSQLPDDLKRKGEDRNDQEEDGSGREELENAVSLVGTCRHMCPDDELLKREREGDIQLLEIPQPGTIHPQGWTLRETAVKRFRRSAADFKLNVPEWVRPPDVLESVCGYLEEWVMERDRQGADPRFTQSESPPPLDVYQFIWDRTRMVRKDFVLQNYVGTGGNCDARAVRCHERIARWHAMCEHQLSHIPDFVNMQSQQNIQELGQTMKTLNMYYDDSLGRSTVEPENAEKGAHGCKSLVVMGKPPVDYNGSPLDNNSIASNRLIGDEAVKTPFRGTAEPEMRGLYMLLTMDTDGGSEVLNYAARLFRERRRVYNSKPVQLALRIYKAKKEYNYARFFSILRSSSTPYLFACIMFKHVQLMRRAAFLIMSRTYGARKKTGEALYDVYPLKNLTRLLCFEDDEEALEACTYYNITVDKIESSSGKSVQVVRWRKSDFQVSKDPVKGTVLPIKPRKMIRTVEAKLNGATRLAVCRGDVSGEGASLSEALMPACAAAAAASHQTQSTQLERATEEPAPLGIPLEAAKAEEERRQEEEDARVRAEKERQLQEVRDQEEAERQRREQLEKQKAEEALRAELLRKKQQEAELKRKQAAEEERRKREAEEAKRAEMAAAAEERRRQKQQAEADRLAAELEAARRKAEEEERERERQLALKLKLEEERLMKLREEEEARRRREEEEKRLRLLEIQRQREEDERKRKEAERRRKEELERKIALEWKRKIDSARKLLFWRRWRKKVERRLEDERSKEALRRIDRTYGTTGNLSRILMDHALDYRGFIESDNTEISPVLGIRDYFLRQKLGAGVPLNLANVLSKPIERTLSGFHKLELRKRNVHHTFLCKIAVILPESSLAGDSKFFELIHEWFDSRLRYGHVSTCQAIQNISHVELRTVAVNGNDVNMYASCDVALFVVPPCPASKNYNIAKSLEYEMLDKIHESTPRLVLNLDDGSVPEYTTSVQSMVSGIVGNTTDNAGVVCVGETGDLETRLDNALERSCLALFEAYCDGYPEQLPSLERIPLPLLARLCISDVMWGAGYIQRTQADKQILSLARATVTSLVVELNSLGHTLRNTRLSNWPPKEFAEESSFVVKDYFGRNEHLPLSWKENLFEGFAEPVLGEVNGSLSGSFRYVIENMLSRAPLDVRNDCEAFIDSKQFGRCLESALLWKESNDIAENLNNRDEHLYIPQEAVENIRQAVTKRTNVRNDVPIPSYPHMPDQRWKNLDDIFSNTRDDEQAPALLSLEHEKPPQVVATMSDEDFVKETPALQRSSKDKPEENDQELEFFGLHADIVPFEQGVGDFDGQPSVFQSSLNTQHQKSVGHGLEGEDFLRNSKRYMDSPIALDRQVKRRRGGSPAGAPSEEQRESESFTHKLEALLHGEATIDVDIGDTKLSQLLGNHLSQIELP